MALLFTDDTDHLLNIIDQLRPLLSKNISSNTNILRIETKYYNANVPFHTLKISDNVDPCQISGEPQLILLAAKNMDDISSNTILSIMEGFEALESFIFGVAQPLTDPKQEEMIESLGFEIVNLGETNSEPNSIGAEKVGMERVAEIFQTTMWTNMTRVETPKKSASGVQHKTLEAEQVTEGANDDMNYLQACITGDDMLPTDEESFEILLRKVQQMKLSMNGMSDEERKNKAASIAMELLQLIDDSEEQEDC